MHLSFVGLPIVGAACLAARCRTTQSWRPLLGSLHLQHYQPQQKQQHTCAYSCVTTMHELRQELIRAIDHSPHLNRVAEADKDLARFRSYDGFKHYLSRRFNLREIHRRGEDSFIRRVMHLFLVSKGDPEYAEMLKAWIQLREEQGGRQRQQEQGPVTFDKLWSSSQSHGEKAMVNRAFNSARKSVEQLAASVEALKVAVANEGGEAVEKTLREREERLVMLRERESVGGALAEVVGRIDERLEELRGKVLPLSSSSPSNAAYLEECRQDGPATEKEVKAVMTSCLQSGGEILREMRYLTKVDIKSLEGELREESKAVAQRPEYRGVEFPKAEIDGLFVVPRKGSGGEDVLDVVMAVEVKRSIDQLPEDAAKYRMLLDILCEACRRSKQRQIKFTYAGQTANKSSEVLDFSSDTQGLYVVKVGSTLRVAEPLLHAVVQMVNQDDLVGTESRLLDYFAVDLARAEGGDQTMIEEAKNRRDLVITALFDSFLQRGFCTATARLDALKTQLAVDGLCGDGEPAEGMRVYTLTSTTTGTRRAVAPSTNKA